MEINDMTREDIETRRAEIKTEMASEDADLDALEAEARSLKERETELNQAEEQRAEVEAKIAEAPAAPEINTRMKGEKTVETNTYETRAKQFAETGRTSFDVRTLLTTGNLVEPDKADVNIQELPTAMSSIVDDVKAVSALGNGAWVVPYRTGWMEASAVTEGETIPSGTEDQFNYVSIQPDTWGVLCEVSNMVKKLSPVDYMSSVQMDAVLSLRRYAKSVIATAVQESDLAEAVSYEIDENYLRSLVLGYDCDEGVNGGTKLYLCKADLQALGEVRGTNEKRPLYEITFTDENNGTISEGGTMVRFSILSDLSEGTQLYGNPQTIVMPMWGPYEIATDEGGVYFQRNVIGIRGLQTASAALCAYHGMQVVTSTTSE